VAELSAPEKLGVPLSRIRLAAMIGTTVEYYDFFVYSIAAVWVFPILFFPKGNPTTAQLASLATFGLAFLSRPLGSLLFGHFGDRIGRKSTLVATMTMMGVGTFLIGLLPTYQQIGVAATVMLALLRILQGIALGGEWCGATLLTVETSPRGQRAWSAMWAQLGSPMGFLIANAVFVAILSRLPVSAGRPDVDGAFLTWGWRIPFLFSAVMIAIGLYARLRLTETPVFADAVERGEPVRAPIAEVFRCSFGRLLLGSLLMLASYTLFYIVVAWALSYATAQRPPIGRGLGYGYLHFIKLQMIAVVMYAAMIPVGGRLADRLGRRPTLIAVLGGVIAFGAAFPVLLAPSAPPLVFLCTGMALTGLAAGTMGPVLPELFPTAVRYTGSGISYSMASILGAAIAPFIALWLSSRYGVAAVGGYLAAAASISLTAAVLMPETRDETLVGVG